MHIPTWVAPTRVQISKHKYKNVEKYKYKYVEKKYKNKNTLFNTTLTEQLSKFGLCTFQLGLPHANFKKRIYKYKNVVRYKYRNKNTLFNAKLVTNTSVFGVFRGSKT